MSYEIISTHDSKINKLEKRVTDLEYLAKQLRSAIIGLLAVVTALFVGLLNALIN